MLASRIATGSPTQFVTSGTSGVDVAALFGSPSGPIAYTLIVEAGVIVGRQSPLASTSESRLAPTLDATGLHQDSIGLWLIDGYVLGGGGRGLNGGDRVAGPAGEAGGGAGGGAGYPAGTAGVAGDDGAGGAGGATAGAAGDDTSISGTSPAGGAAGTSSWLVSPSLVWNDTDWALDFTLSWWGVATQLGHTLSATPEAVIESGGDAARTNHDVQIVLGSSARLWGGGGAGVPGYRGIAPDSNPGDDGTAPGVDQAFASETGTQLLTGGESGYAVRLSSGAAATLSGNTGSAFVKGSVA